MNGLLVIILSRIHAAAGGAENHRKLCNIFPTGMSPGFLCGQQKHQSCPVQTFDLLLCQVWDLRIRRQIDFCGFPGPLLGDIKKRDFPEGGVSGAETFGVDRPARTE